MVLKIKMFDNDDDDFGRCTIMVERVIIDVAADGGLGDGDVGGIEFENENETVVDLKHY